MDWEETKKHTARGKVQHSKYRRDFSRSSSPHDRAAREGRAEPPSVPPTPQATASLWPASVHEWVASVPTSPVALAQCMPGSETPPAPLPPSDHACQDYLSGGSNHQSSERRDAAPSVAAEVATPLGRRGEVRNAAPSHNGDSAEAIHLPSHNHPPTPAAALPAICHTQVQLNDMVHAQVDRCRTALAQVDARLESLCSSTASAEHQLRLAEKSLALADSICQSYSNEGQLAQATVYVFRADRKQERDRAGANYSQQVSQGESLKLYREKLTDILRYYEQAQGQMLSASELLGFLPEASEGGGDSGTLSTR